MLHSNLAPSPFPTLREQAEISDELNLIAAGWRFAAEVTGGDRWVVLGTKGETRISFDASRLGEAFREVEREARRRERRSMDGGREMPADLEIGAMVTP